ncbi:MAG: hypothetical protein KDA20_07250 [Phycisphaerales bacterium]|nr:hypothetical protein [Phycisphaerales bacterium]
MGQGQLTIAVYQEATGWSLAGEYVDRIREAAGDQLSAQQVSTSRDLLAALPETRAIIGLPVSAAQLAQHGSALEWVQLTDSLGDATPALMHACAAGVRVSTASSIRAVPIAEHAVALLLAMVRRVGDCVLAQAEHRWAASDLASRIHTLAGRRVGVFAHGQVLRAIMGRLSAFGVELIASSPDPMEAAAEGLAQEVVRLSAIDDVMERCDAIVMALPRLPATAGLIARKQFAAANRRLVIVDVSRGGVIDHRALLEALHRRRIAGAALDAFETTPLPPTSPLWTMPNVIVSPGISAASPQYWRRGVDVICRNVKRFVAGEPLEDELPAAWVRAAS